MVPSLAMARRPRPPDEMLSRKELAELQGQGFDDGHFNASGLLPEAHTLYAGSDQGISQREGDSGAGHRLEAAQEVSVAKRWPVGRTSSR
jgi:hypothetical protein